MAANSITPLEDKKKKKPRNTFWPYKLVYKASSPLLLLFGYERVCRISSLKYMSLWCHEWVKWCHLTICNMDTWPFLYFSSFILSGVDTRESLRKIIAWGNDSNAVLRTKNVSEDLKLYSVIMLVILWVVSSRYDLNSTQWSLNPNSLGWLDTM